MSVAYTPEPYNQVAAFLARTGAVHRADEKFSRWLHAERSFL